MNNGISVKAVVLDTNVLVAGLRSRHGASSAVLRRMGRRQFLPLISTALGLEYEDVLRRSGLVPGYTPDQITEFLDSFLSLARECRVQLRLRPFLNDPNDEMVFECALAGEPVTW